MGWVARGVIGASLTGSIGGGFLVGKLLPIDLAQAQTVQAAPYDVGVSGPALGGLVADSLVSANVERAARRNRQASRVLVLEKVTYERSAGGVVARGVLNDPAAPRSLRVVIDAYGAYGRYLASGASSVTSAKGAAAFSVAMRDEDTYETFNVRFLEGEAEVPQRLASEAVGELPAIVADTPLFACDLPEVAERLVSLGYAPEDQLLQVEAAILVVAKRFRRDHDLSGPETVTVGDLLALRLTPSRARFHADLGDY